MDFADRAARNEEIFRSVNEQIEAGAEQHRVKAPMPFHCECGRASCVSTIDIPAPDYERIVRERYRFVLIPGHEEPAIEQVVEHHSDFVIVEKIGEARERIDRDHPQQRHQGRVGVALPAERDKTSGRSFTNRPLAGRLADLLSGHRVRAPVR